MHPSVLGLGMHQSTYIRKPPIANPSPSGQRKQVKLGILILIQKEMLPAICLLNIGIEL